MENYLEEKIRGARQRLEAYRTSHPNLVAAWNERLLEQTNQLHQTTARVETATRMFDQEGDLSPKTIALIQLLFGERASGSGGGTPR